MLSNEECHVFYNRGRQGDLQSREVGCTKQ